MEKSFQFRSPWQPGWPHNAEFRIINFLLLFTLKNVHLALCTCTSLPGAGIKMSSVFVPFTTSGFTRLEINVRTAVAQSSHPTDPDMHGKQRENHRWLHQLLTSSVCTLCTGKIESRKIKKKKATIKAQEQKRQVTGTTMLLAGWRVVPFWLTHHSPLVSFQQPTQQPSQDLRAKLLLRQKHFTPNNEGRQFLIVTLVFTESKGLSTSGKITFLLLDNICAKNVKQGERFPWTSVTMIQGVELNSDGF